MEFPIAPNLTPLSRQEALRVWMSRNGLTFTEMARRMDVTSNNVSKLCDQDTMPVHRHAQLLGMGVPMELLPEALDLKPGPKPRTIHDEAMAAFRGV
ncbi:MAG: helix-turn-helix transcriptional regulator [Proteobacteria bacterium]|nr:helix-turn-helix transcriptional regulator [Pseudomonadota bacterium]MBU1594284.1 helix-turn-helix transcriptional regulator [Pseudomonadota bacterium]